MMYTFVCNLVLHFYVALKYVNFLCEMLGFSILQTKIQRRFSGYTFLNQLSNTLKVSYSTFGRRRDAVNCRKSPAERIIAANFSQDWIQIPGAILRSAYLFQKVEKPNVLVLRILAHVPVKTKRYYRRFQCILSRNSDDFDLGKRPWQVRFLADVPDLLRISHYLQATKK